MDIFQNYISILSGDYTPSEDREAQATPHVESNGSSKKEVVIPVKFKADVEKLQGMYGAEFKDGATIIMNLQQALSVLPRDRKRTDAYRNLCDWLKDNMGIELIIKSQKSKLQ